MPIDAGPSNKVRTNKRISHHMARHIDDANENARIEREMRGGKRFYEYHSATPEEGKRKIAIQNGKRGTTPVSKKKGILERLFGREEMEPPANITGRRG